ncbi:GNAT family N-acetyltransferase [Rhodobacter sp. SY28-1]|uniref:GNAT family N-acetyltransferase n=1 Tax=Rhodobacter sp. SY28-1 TaxID=2562317 RepID=UPI0010C13F04|nr:GNAT family N-acetyltransferase [Rhodobacter sp. SY28-1]
MIHLIARQFDDAVPVLRTERLVLRAPRPDDFDAYATYYAEDRSRFTGGPLDRPTAWRAFAAQIGHWHLRGYGLWTVTDATEAPVGHVGFWNPEGWLEREIGWALYPGHEGKGYAYEAAMAARTHAYTVLGWGPLTSVIAPGNDRSIALAVRMGATFERDWVSPSGKPALIYRHPGPGGAA